MSPLAILDIGATLVDGPSSGPASRIARELALTSVQKRRLRADLMTLPFTGPDEVAAHVRRLPGGVDGPVEDAVAMVWTAQEAEATPLPGAADALRALHAGGVRLALISNIWAPYLTAVRRHLGALFDELVAPELQRFSFREGMAKPDRRLFAGTIAAAGVDPAAAVMVGDSHAEDIAPADDLGLRTVWVHRRPEREAGALAAVRAGRAARPTRVVASVAELDAALVRRICDNVAGHGTAHAASA